MFFFSHPVAVGVGCGVAGARQGSGGLAVVERRGGPGRFGAREREMGGLSTSVYSTLTVSAR